jgi:hypothetical protein
LIELGLHSTFAAQPGGLLTGSETQARKITFWGCFILENLSAICIGRITTLPQLAIISSKPILVQQLESKVWQPHGVPNLTQEDFTNLQQASHKYGIQFQLSCLCEILDGILQMFYAPAARVTDTKLLQTWAKLQRWLECLPAGLHLSPRGATLPQIITLQSVPCPYLPLSADGKQHILPQLCYSPLQTLFDGPFCSIPSSSTADLHRRCE